MVQTLYRMSWCGPLALPMRAPFPLSASTPDSLPKARLVYHPYFFICTHPVQGALVCRAHPPLQASSPFLPREAQALSGSGQCVHAQS